MAGESCPSTWRRAYCSPGCGISPAASRHRPSRTSSPTSRRGGCEASAVRKSVRIGGLTAGAGVLLLIAATRLAPVWHAPLFDGVVIEDPYRYLDPPPGKPGSPTSVSETLALDQGESPQLYSGTLETPPQAQMISDRDAFQLPSGTTSIKASIAPIKPPAPVSDGRISGNVYRFAVLNQAGTNLSLLPGTTITLVLRAPNNVANGTIIHFNGI